MPNSPRKPHIVFIVLDTHRYDRLGAYGYTRGTSPNLDAFAQGATVFERAIAPAQWTIPSHASMFTGEFPTTHLTTQSGDALDVYFPTIAEWLKNSGYRSTGFCNNPLVGVIDNELKRGFDTFYNYGGAITSTPARAAPQPVKLLSQVWERYTQLLRRISYPVQNTIARSDRIFRLTLNPAFVPLWTRFANFKGDTKQSLGDIVRFVQQKMTPQAEQPQFLFVNLMETHLPFSAPEPFISRLAPIMKDERAARDFMRVYNTQALRWLLPMEEPFSPLEAQTLSEMYDAEVAYQDHLLAALLERLDHPYHRENTAVIVVADHGEMLGEHCLMGHGFGVYEELVRVPLMIRLPGQSQGRRVAETVSTAQVFHTVLHLAQVEEREQRTINADIRYPLEKPSLARFESKDAASLVVSEAYPPLNVINIIESKKPELLQAFACRSIQRAAYNQSMEKLVQTERIGHTLVHLVSDPSEMKNLLIDNKEGQRHHLSIGLELFLEAARARQPQRWTREQVTIQDQRVLQRLRDLGYID